VGRGAVVNQRGAQPARPAISFSVAGQNFPNAGALSYSRRRSLRTGAVLTLLRGGRAPCFRFPTVRATIT
jgi:hypothetical protein